MLNVAPRSIWALERPYRRERCGRRSGPPQPTTVIANCPTTRRTDQRKRPRPSTARRRQPTDHRQMTGLLPAFLHKRPNEVLGIRFENVVDLVEDRVDVLGQLLVPF